MPSRARKLRICAGYWCCLQNQERESSVSGGIAFMDSPFVESGGLQGDRVYAPHGLGPRAGAVFRPRRKVCGLTLCSRLGDRSRAHGAPVPAANVEQDPPKRRSPSPEMRMPTLVGSIRLGSRCSSRLVAFASFSFVAARSSERRAPSAAASRQSRGVRGRRCRRGAAADRGCR